LKKKIRKELHRETIIDAAKALERIDYCVFYGTALGIHRNGDAIDGDDDADLLANKDDFDAIDEALKKKGFRNSKEVNGQESYPALFSQYYKTRDSEVCLLDVYFYEDVHEDFVVDRWNVFGQPNNKETYLIIPKKMILEHKEVDFFGQRVKVPADSEAVCRYIYGNRFKEPLAKGVDYRHTMVNNRIVIRYFKNNGAKDGR